MTRSAGDTPPVISEVNVDARTTSRVVTPKSFLGLKTFWDLRTSATMGTVEFTGLEMTRIKASGQLVAIPLARSLTMPALILNKSSTISLSVLLHVDTVSSHSRLPVSKSCRLKTESGRERDRVPYGEHQQE